MLRMQSFVFFLNNRLGNSNRYKFRYSIPFQQTCNKWVAPITKELKILNFPCCMNFLFFFLFWYRHLGKQVDGLAIHLEHECACLPVSVAFHRSKSWHPHKIFNIFNYFVIWTTPFLHVCWNGIKYLNLYR